MHTTEQYQWFRYFFLKLGIQQVQNEVENKTEKCVNRITHIYRINQIATFVYDILTPWQPLLPSRTTSTQTKTRKEKVTMMHFTYVELNNQSDHEGLQSTNCKAYTI